MSKHGYLRKQGIVSHSIRVDLLYFAIPALIVFSGGILVTTLDGLEDFIAVARSLNETDPGHTEIPLHMVVGLILILSGYGLMFTSLFTLRKNYSSTLVIRRDHQLVTHGVYRYVRHPIYLGVLIVAAGFTVLAGSLRGFLIMALLLPILLIRIRLEERLLLTAFGEQYQRYQNRTRKLIPFLY